MLWQLKVPIHRVQMDSGFHPEHLPSSSVFCRIGDIVIPIFLKNVGVESIKCVVSFILNTHIRQTLGNKSSNASEAKYYKSFKRFFRLILAL